MDTNAKNDEVEIDLKELFFVILGRIWIIIAIGIFCALCAGLYSKLVMKPLYTSTTKIYVINRQDGDTTTLSDLQSSTQLTKDYLILVKSRPVTEQVISDLNLNKTHEQLVGQITVNTPTDTRILEIRVEDTDPYVAKQIADAVADVSSERMITVMDMKKVNVVEEGNIPLTPSSPNVKMNTLIGGVLGIALSTIVILLIHITNDSIKTMDDVEKYLGLNTLGTIPLTEDPKKSKKKKKKK
jgi:capsular polysaccharide biosynthesis protein